MAEGQLAPDGARYQCKSCERELGANAFYVSNQSKCKECVKSAVRANREANADYYRAYDRKRYREEPKRKENARRSSASPAGEAARARYAERTRLHDREKYSARNALGNAIRDGKVKKKPCFFCGSEKRIQAHHEDYSHALDVVWLCASCHGKYHTIKGDFRRAKAQQEATP